MILKRLDVATDDAEQIRLAFYLHHANLPNPHPCLLSLAQDDALLQKTRELHEAYLRSLHRFRLPSGVMDALTHIYERFDGEGFPARLRSENIPLGSRLIALMDTYEDLLFHEPNADGEEIIDRLGNHKGKLFDPQIFACFEKELLRFEKYNKGEIHRVLLLDPDTDLTHELEKQLSSRGFWVQVCHDIPHAEEICSDQKIDLVILELEFPDGADGFSFVEKVKETKSPVPEFLFITRRDNAEDIDKGIALARDYWLKPVNPNVIVLKINKLLQQIQQEKKSQKGKERNRQGIAGSLEQIGLPDLLQVLSQGRRSGQLTIYHTDAEVGYIYLDTGSVINAIIGKLKGEQAFYRMMSWEKGEFSLDPNAQTKERLINAPLDGLILDSLRMLDESRRDGVEPFEEGEMFAGEEKGEEHFDFDLDDDDPKEDVTESKSHGNIKHEAKEGGLDDLFNDLKEDDFDKVFPFADVANNGQDKKRSSSKG